MADEEQEEKKTPSLTVRGLETVTQPAVLDEHGERFKVAQLWAERKLVVCFARHFGCRFCRQQVAGLNSIDLELRSNNVGLVVISIGTPSQIAQFREETGFLGEIYVDANVNTCPAYDALRLKSSKSYVRDNPRTADVGKTALEAGFTDGGYGTDTNPYTGDVFRVGGVFVMGPGNSCDFAYRSQFAGDHPLPSRVLAAALGTQQQPGTMAPATEAWSAELNTTQLSSGSHRRARTNAHTVAMTVGDLAATATAAATAAAPAAAAAAAAAARGKQPPVAIRLAKGGALAALLLAVAAAHGRGLLAASEAAMMGLVVFALAVLLAQPKKGKGKKGKRKDAGTKRGTKPPSAVAAAAAAVNIELKKSDDLSHINPEIRELVVALITVKGVDEASIAHGMLKCDCAAVVDDTNVAEEMLPDDPTTRERSRSLAIPEGHSVDARGLHVMLTMNCYFRQFLAKPHPLLGRGGPTCPFVPAALKMDSMYMRIVQTPRDVGRDVVRAIAEKYLHVFHALEPRSGRKSIYKAVVLVFPDVPLDRTHDVIDGAQADLKAQFVEKGLMLGEFHRRNNMAGLHNPDFYPLRTPYPSLALRNMVYNDLVFLSGSQYSPATRVSFLSSYVGRLQGSDKLNSKEAEHLVSAQQLLATASAELAAQQQQQAQGEGGEDGEE